MPVIDADGMKQKIFSVTIEPALGELRGLACVCGRYFLGGHRVLFHSLPSVTRVRQGDVV